MNRLITWILSVGLAFSSAAHAQTVEYIHTDALGTPVAVTDVNRNVIERSEYEPFGAVINRPVKDGPGYTGHVEDAATGLTYMQQRYYDPTIGRFLSVDPVEANGHTGANFNRYKYALNNPYKFTDPDGRCESIATCQMMRDDLDVMAGRMSRQEHSERQTARGVGAAVGAGLLVASRIRAPCKCFPNGPSARHLTESYRRSHVVRLATTSKGMCVKLSVPVATILPRQPIGSSTV